MKLVPRGSVQDSPCRICPSCALPGVIGTGDSPQLGPRTLCQRKEVRRLAPLKSSWLDQPFYRDEHLFVDLRHEVVTVDSETVRLTRMQYRVLALLVKHAGVAVTRSILLMQIWGHAPEMDPRSVDTHVNGLRRKLGPYADQYLETVHGVGYRFRPLLGL